MTDHRVFVIIGIFTIFIFIHGCTVKKHSGETSDIQPPEIGYDYLWVIKPAVNIRSHASANSSQIGTLNDGDSVIVISNKDGWYHIRTQSIESGWIRSDLLGPYNLSIYPKAVAFSDSIKSADNVDIFFDKRLHHRRIYLTFPPDQYASRNDIVQVSAQISAAYQTTVYSGDFSVVVLISGSQDVYYPFEQSGLVNSDIFLPVAPFGKIIDAQFGPDKVALTYTVDEKITPDTYIDAARKMVGIYPISYREIQLTFLDENKKCRFWYKEDDSGEIFRTDSCP